MTTEEQKPIITKWHARQRMVERNILHKDVVKTIKDGVKVPENGREIRAICKVEDDRYITCIYLDQRKQNVVLTAYESGRTDINLYQRMKK